MDQIDLDSIRRAALDRIEASRKSALRLFIAAAVFEGIMLVAVFLMMDFGNKTHWLIFFCTCLIYGPLALGLMALRSYIDVCTQRVLKAVELTSPGS